MIRLEAPDFWFDTKSATAQRKALLLKPFAWLWQRYTRTRTSRQPTYVARAKVICIGNVTAGGAGKTPLAMSILEALREAGMCASPCFLTRGFGGDTAGPILVDTHTAKAKKFGDEALLLARHAPTIVARDRAQGLQLADAQGFDVVIVDDGFQNPAFAKSLSLLVFDGARGIGNGQCIPAGPCREDLRDAIPRAAAAIIVGEDKTNLRAKLHALPAFAAHFKTAYCNHQKPYVAFAGIGRPAKFFETLAENNYNVLKTFPFPDHHAFDGTEIGVLIAEAGAHDARLITTEKDFVRLPDEAKAVVDVLPVNLKVDGMPELLTLMRTKLATA